MLYSIIGILVIILDQLVKYFVDKNINWSRPVIELIPNVISLVRVQNDGAAFSFLSGGSARIWFILLTAIFAILVVIALATNFVSGSFGRWCLVFITAGGLSNMIDRVRFGYVIDMFRIDMFDFAVFNVADIFITVFCIAFILYILFGGEKEREEDDEFEEDFEEEELPPRRSRSSRRAAEYDYEEKEEELPPRRSRRKAISDEVTYEERPATEHQRRKQRETAVRRAEASEIQKRNMNEMKTVQRSRAQKVAEKTDDALFEEMFGSKQEAGSAQTATRRQAAPAQTKRTAAKSVQTEDPFADWERANARASAASREAYNRAADTVDRVKAAAAEKDDAFSDFLSSSTQRKTEKTAAKTAAPAKAKAAPAVSSSDDEFDLDSILNEFK